MKLIFTIYYQENIKFKVPFNTQNNTKTFKDLKLECIKRLQIFSKSAPEILKNELPTNYDPNQFILSDADDIYYLDQDKVEELCSNDDTIFLLHNNQIQSRISQNSFIEYFGINQNQPQIQRSIISYNSVPTSTRNTTQNNFQIREISKDEIYSFRSDPNQVLSPKTQSSESKNVTVKVSDVNILPEELLKQNKLQSLSQSFYLQTNPSSFLVQQAADFKFCLKFPQSQNPKLEYFFQFSKEALLVDASNQLCKYFNLNPNNFTFAFYNMNGLPYCAELKDQHHLKLSETLYKTFEFCNYFYAIATQTDKGKKSSAKLNHEQGPQQIKIIRVDLVNDTVLMLKQKIYSKLNIQTANQELIFGSKTLQDELTLNHYNIQNDSTIVLQFVPEIQSTIASSFQENFYSPWMKHFQTQTIEGQRSFRCHLMIIASHIESIFTKLSGLIRDWSHNNSPLLTTLQYLKERRKLNQLQKIALEEGFICLFYDLIESSQSVPIHFKIENILEQSRNCFATILNGIKQLQAIPAQWTFNEVFKQIDTKCSLTCKQIEKPALRENQSFQNNELYWDIVDLSEAEKIKQQEMQGQNSQSLKIIEPNWLKNGFIFTNLLGSEVIVWMMENSYKIAPETNSIAKLPKNWFACKDDPLNYFPYKIYSAVELKEHPDIPVMTRDSKEKLVIYTENRFCDDQHPINLYDPINGKELPENPDDLALKQLTKFSTESTAVEQEESKMPQIELITSIVREPDEAILVLFDISYSMSLQFFDSKDLQRIGAVKAFFNAFADRSMGYNLRNVVSLAYFDNFYELKCTFTEVFGQFKELVNRASPRGNTALFDALIQASEQLVNFKQQYPKVLLRIIALTDGDDTESKAGVEKATKIILENDIVLDAFAVNDKCQSLKQIAHATGGKAFLPKSLKEGLKLFEHETILTSKYRKAKNKISYQELNNITQLLQSKQNLPFDSDPFEMKLPDQIAKKTFDSSKIIEDIQKYALTKTLKRIIKELIDYQKSPHPYVKIFPCEDEISFWKIILIGPEKTPYAGGLFILYIQFPIEYPQQPPEIRFITPIYHCNINAQGRICHSLLGRNYTSDLRIKQCFDCIFGLLMTPEPENTSDTNQATEFIQNLELYKKNALTFTQKHANQTIEVVAKQILGQLNPQQFKEKFDELEEWYESIQIQISFGN